jgi:hypothetical protein
MPNSNDVASNEMLWERVLSLLVVGASVLGGSAVLLIMAPLNHSPAAGDGNSQQERDQQRTKRGFARDVSQDAQRHSESRSILVASVVAAT